ncbi:MAG TPA: tRNA pseudouridine(38-40) synthase TruA [Candidatus Binataceae bacterium]|nr:tRNA pseudouridine(38-40) synthase TruA [Candidatus Binataceae bacterium]
MRFRLTLEYDGSTYSGWQLQRGQGSIQAELEAALARLFGVHVRVHGAGRTDAGVHALGQVAAFDAPRVIAPAELHRALNALLPGAIAVSEVAVAPSDFHPRRNARSRVYEYRILNRPYRSPFTCRYAWWIKDRLDADRMNLAARAFVGEHDFAAFRAVGSAERTTMRRVMRSEWEPLADQLIYRVEGSAFLRHMVRTMVGVMVEVGRGRLAPEVVPALLASGNRAAAPAAAPACGLFLVAVRY